MSASTIQADDTVELAVDFERDLDELYHKARKLLHNGEGGLKVTIEKIRPTEELQPIGEP